MNELKNYAPFPEELDNSTEATPESTSESEQEQQEPISQPNTATTDNFEEETIAQKAGVMTDNNEKQLEEEEPIEPADVATTGDCWDRVGLKTVGTGGLLLLVVAIFFVTGHSLTTLFDNNERVARQDSSEAKEVKPEEEDIGALKTSSAIGSQKAQLQKINSALARQASRQQPKPTANPSPKATRTPEIKITPSKPKPAPPTVRVASAPPPPIPKPAPVVTRKRNLPPQPKPIPVVARRPVLPPPKPVPVVARRPPVLPTQPKPVVTPKIAKTPPPAPIVQSKAKVKAVKEKPKAQFYSVVSPPSDSTSTNPDEAWQAAARVGLYSVDESNSNQVFSETESQNTATNPTYQAGSQVIVGTSALAKLQTPVTWTGKSSYEQSHLIKLSEAIKSADGNTVIPKESTIIAQVKSVSPEGWLDMSAVSVIFPPSSNSVQKPISSGAIVIQSANGSPLRAEYKTMPYFKDDTSKSLDNHNTLSISNSTSLSPSRTSRLIALRKALDKNGRKAKTKRKNNQLLKQKNTPRFRILTLDKGSKVQVYVNRSFAL
ncbi:hypothetical protein NIES267_73260 (plasmid) [Calothrix parasitica NIES-267]|uniref:Uncharacterized protein n=1 Tax=Calothrix parasitica NIES-267 TaxID=1973488 RepID=A0A1Z4M2V4_9CYAN|nr:hypothetical protein NIES267_73260 [Calothrix parasitica NIES-267]